MTEIAIVGAGIAGLALALNLRERGIESRLYEVAPEVKEIGVGITLLPHAMRELTALGLGDALAASAIETGESAFFNRFGQLIYKEPRGRQAGYQYPELGIHRGRLHMILYQAACARLGPGRVLTDRQCVGLVQEGGRVLLGLKQTSTGADLPAAAADIVIGCDGINSAVRRAFYPEEEVAFAGINTWRGVTRMRPILGGRTYLRIGSIRTGKLVAYPIVDAVDAEGNQLINWMAEIESPERGKNDWNKPGRLEDFLPIYRDWRFDWLDVPAMMRSADMVLEYPMVDKDPIPRWSFGRVTLAGDAAHPMYPRGSNGAAQALVDARALAELIAHEPSLEGALAAYEAARLEPASRVVRTNRENPPDFINIHVEDLTGDRPFDDLDRFVTQEELRALSERYKRIAGFALEDMR